MHSLRRLNRLATALGARSYLEIGVGVGLTFRSVDVAERTAVDPVFRFDHRAAADDRSTYCEITSDEFFADLPRDRLFDLIFIDGLHTFEQTYRDICNCLAHSHPDTVWLIDDTIPSDIFSAIPDEERALALRRTTGSKSQAWHGDVFKVVFAIHDFHPGLAYRTIVGSGNPQTLVWRQATGLRTPRFDSLERVSRLTYIDFLEHGDLFRRCTEDEAIDQCVAELAPT